MHSSLTKQRQVVWIYKRGSSLIPLGNFWGKCFFKEVLCVDDARSSECKDLEGDTGCRIGAETD